MFWQDATASRNRPGDDCGDGSVRVRPARLRWPSAVKRYQYQREEARPASSTCTLWAPASRASTVPAATRSRNASSPVISQCTRTAGGNGPCSACPAGASRVHKTTPSGVG